MPIIRVLLAEDSITVRKRLRDVLSTDPQVEVIAEAADGKQAIKLCRELRPDVISLDMMMPEMSGLAATEYIMAHCPTPILIVSASFNRGELFKTYDALAAGAVEVLEKPRGDASDQSWESSFISAIKLVSRIKVITHPRGRLRHLEHSPGPSKPIPSRPPPVQSTHEGAPRAIAIGASTGGPGALVDVFRGMPPKLPLPILVVLHIGEPFGTAFADWLDGQTPQRVVYATGGESLTELSGVIVLAPPGRHMLVSNGRIQLNSAPERHSCRPSVDVLFESLAREQGASTLACLLTGMGRDGAAGLLEIRRAGGFTIAQDEESCVVYGMPREAALLGAACRMLPLSQIGPWITRSVEQHARSER
jgi:two-component system chemotaxis response regulator CheB